MLTTGLGAALLATVLAQAEPAPPEPPPPPPPGAAPAPQPGAAPAPLPEPLEPPRVPTNAVSVQGRFAYRPGDDGTVAPRAGFSLGATLQHRYARVGEIVGLGVGIDFSHDQFSSGDTFRQGQSVLPQQRRLTQDSFVVMQTVALEPDAPVRAWLAAGGGLTVGAAADSTEVMPVVRGALGLDVTIASRTALVLRGDYTQPLTHPSLGPVESPFGGFLDVGLGFQVWF